jgi:hypothetical protein
MRTIWLVSALALSGLLAVLEELTLKYFILWHHPWFDTVLHAVGGAAIGTFVIGLLHGSFRPLRYLALAVIASVCWEVFEYAIGSTQVRADFTLDTASDLLFDAVGALVPYAVARYTLWRPAHPV